MKYNNNFCPNNTYTRLQKGEVSVDYCWTLRYISGYTAPRHIKTKNPNTNEDDAIAGAEVNFDSLNQNWIPLSRSLTNSPLSLSHALISHQMELLDSSVDLREVQKLEGHADRVWSLAWNPAPSNCGGASAMLASCSGDKTVRIWQMGPTRQWDCSVRRF